MGAHVELSTDPDDLRRFSCALINDIKALDQMLERNVFETAPMRIGAELEVCLVNSSWRPAPLSMKVLEAIGDPHFTTEHSLYNLELNLDPIELGGDCLYRLEGDLDRYIARLDRALAEFDGAVIMMGILPTIRRSDLRLDNLTPLDRYHVLNNALTKLRGGPYEFRIEGLDELITRHSSIMFEGCNTSFQVHLQVRPEEAVAAYNWSQAISAPLLAASTFSPLLLGKRLWQETRIALFQQSIDTRRSESDTLRVKHSRITFGNRWLEKSVTELFREDLAAYRLICARDVPRDSLEALAAGEIPALTALQLHNGTVYRWNRLCYGITGEKPHLRIENRVLPSGPSVVDQVANAAFWLGMMNARPKACDRIGETFDFDDARLNFIKAAHHGLETCFHWFGGEMRPAIELILDELIPMARDGLTNAGVDAGDRDRYLGIIEERVRANCNGSRWVLDNHRRLIRRNDTYEVNVAITAASHQYRKTGQPVHRWGPVEIDFAGDWVNRFFRVSQIMATDIFAVREIDPIYFVSNVMTWRHLRFVPVEDSRGALAGLITRSKLLELLADGETNARQATAAEAMITDPLTVTPDTLTLDALDLMRAKGIGCLPVVRKGKLVGMLTELELMSLSEHTLHGLRAEKKAHLEVQGRVSRRDRSPEQRPEEKSH